MRNVIKALQKFAETKRRTTTEKKAHTHTRSDSLIGGVLSYRQSQTQRIRLPIKCIFSGAPTKNQIGDIGLCVCVCLLFFSLCYFCVPFSIARPISHNWKVEMVFVCRCTGYNQSHWNPNHRTESDQMLLTGQQKRKKKTKSWAPERLEKIQNQRKTKSKHRANMLRMCQKAKRLILTVNIDTSDYLSMYATLSVTTSKWMERANKRQTETIHQKIHMFWKMWTGKKESSEWQFIQISGQTNVLELR